METMRTLFVWVADLALYYSPLGGSGKVGEQWDSHSWMQARGPKQRLRGILRKFISYKFVLSEQT